MVLEWSQASYLLPFPLLLGLVVGLGVYVRKSRPAQKGLDPLADADAEQVHMMEERCILVDEQDNVIGSDTKKACHLNSGGLLLHRAFSVFLFDSRGRLMLQQRASTKITFADYWANTCCSHPLYTPTELEEHAQCGVKRAAQRKLAQELGIPREQVPLSSFNFISRIHYRAGSDGMWGEHEIDYILFCQPPRDVTLELNPNEVADARYFSQDEMRAFVNNAKASGDLISPWFLAIHNLLLHTWWDLTLSEGDSGAAVEPSDTIHRIDASDPLAPRLITSAAAVTTGAVHAHLPIFQAPTWRTVFKPRDLAALVKVARHQIPHAGAPLATVGSEDEKWCESMLMAVSRSFALVIQQLPADLRRAIGIFYLVLRALDTIEDDPVVPIAVKQAMLVDMYTHLSTKDWTTDVAGEAHEREVLEQFDRVLRVMHTLSPEAQTIITDVTRQMGEGMAKHAEMEGSPDEVAQYDDYCYYVAGLVGVGLTKLFATIGNESATLVEDESTAIAMGLFLQKVNITRDFTEDLLDTRQWWPKDIWGRFVDRLPLLHDSNHRADALAALNAMITNALEHVPECVSYLLQLRDVRVFRFCAIPQVMAIATLTECYNNYNVFRGIVKIPKATSCRFMCECDDVASYQGYIREYATKLQRLVPQDDPSAKETHAVLNRILESCGDA